MDFEDTDWECGVCGYTWTDNIEPETNSEGEYVCDRCEGEEEE